MDADAWKILIGAIAVIASGLGGQWISGRNSRLSADASHKRDRQKWATDLKYQTYLNLVKQFESTFFLISRATRGDMDALSEAWSSINSLKATDLRIVGSPQLRRMANELDTSFRLWHSDVATGSITPDEYPNRREENLGKFQSLVEQVRSEIGTAEM